MYAMEANTAINMWRF